MAGIYLHIPFCKQACTYCNFHFTTSLRYKDEMVQAIALEARQEKAYLEGQTVNTIYFGGGTPSLLEISDLELLIEELQKHYTIASDAEITLEANPDDISIEKLKAWKSIDINRLSIGVQSFVEEELRWMNRAHSAELAVGSLQFAVEHFQNITMDLIYGSPLLTDEQWKRNVDTALSFGIPHLSCYALTVEEKTPLDKLIRTNQRLDVDDEKQSHQFLLLMQWLREAGYEHYEVSNFAKPGFRSRHNSSYWKGESYLGLGPSAHSYNGVQRRWNVANNAVYIRSAQEGAIQREEETLSLQNRINENIMISLRTMEGLDLQIVKNEFGAAEQQRLEKGLPKFLEAGWIKRSGDVYRLSDEGMLRADGIAATLFV
jgi:oxygen-independent coproporphyrinogen III oxidase